MIIPETAFGIFSALSGPMLTTNLSPSRLEILKRLPRVVLWNWLNLLLFNIANQRLPGSIQEDMINKPWRAIPSKRLTPDEARRLLLAVIPIALFGVWFLGGVTETLAMITLTWMYNDLGGADENYLVRNIINALGCICYSSGSIVVAAGYGTYELNQQSRVWLKIVGAIIFSTIQMQDLADMEGDEEHGRRTLPLVHGEIVARWSIAVPVVLWSVFCSWFWQVGALGCIPSLLIGGILAVRVVGFKGVKADRITWKLWCLWTTTLYLLPLAAFALS